MADAFVRSGTYRRVLLIGAELHSHSLDFTTRGRDVTVLFGDGAGAMVLGPTETDDPRAGVIYTSAHADGNGATDLNLKIFEIQRLPYIDYDPRDRERNKLMYPHMDGKRVFLNAVRGMVMSTMAALAKTGMSWDDIQWFVPHQANLRINEKVVRGGEDPGGEGAEHDRVLRQHDGRRRCRSRSITGASREGEAGPIGSCPRCSARASPGARRSSRSDPGNRGAWPSELEAASSGQ